MGGVYFARTLILVLCLLVIGGSPTSPIRAQAAPTFVVNNAADVPVISGALDNGVCETLPGSPAINTGSPAGCTSWDGTVLQVDQRGYPRPVVGCDLGAFEVAQQVFLPLLRR